MLDQVAAAFECKDYRTAAQLLQTLQQQSPQDPWVQFYRARLQEVSGIPTVAEQKYRQLLRECSNPDLLTQVRQRLQQLGVAEKEPQSAQAVANSISQEPGSLVPEPIAQLAAAFERQDYRNAAQLLQQLQQQSPQDPWVQFYGARLQEVAGKPEMAEQVYRRLLRDCPNPKLMAQARQGLQRLEATEKDRRQQAIAQAVANPTNQEPGFLVLEAIAPENRNAAVQAFSQIMKVDAYTARGLLPSRGWRLYRTGPVGELSVYGQELRQAEIPVFWAALPDLQKIKVFQVKYFQALMPKPTVVCMDETNQMGALTFDWAEVAQRVEGLLPLFSQVVDLGYRDRLEWKDHIQDYAHFCDLHLPQRRCILRLYDDKYDFHQGVSAQTQHDTIRQHWNDLKLFLNQQLAQRPLWSEFTVFSETVSDFDSAIGRLKSHMTIPRASDCYLDTAFHLYSSLAFLQFGK